MCMIQIDKIATIHALAGEAGANYSHEEAVLGEMINTIQSNMSQVTSDIQSYNTLKDKIYEYKDNSENYNYNYTKTINMSLGILTLFTIIYKIK